MVHACQWGACIRIIMLQLLDPNSANSLRTTEDERTLFI